MVNLVLKYFWMYMLMGIIINIGTAVVYTIWYGAQLNWNNEAMDKVLDIIGGIGYSKIVHSFFKTKDGTKQFLLAFICTQLIWPANVAHILLCVPEVNEFCKEYRQRQA